jgi:hypothetical protein
MNMYVDFVGVPKPKAQWFHNDQPLTSGPRMAIESSDSQSSITVSDLRPEDAGQYKLKVTNKAGCQEAVFNINVRGTSLQLIM